MSAITNSFSPNSLGVVSLEVKGRKSGGGRGSEESGGSKGSRPDTIRNLEPKNQPTPAPFVPIIWEIIPPKKENTVLDSSGEAVEAARRKVLEWNHTKTSICDKAKACGSSSSGKSGPVTYDGGKVMARGSGSDVGSKSTAVHSTGGSNSSCTIS